MICNNRRTVTLTARSTKMSHKPETKINLSKGFSIFARRSNIQFCTGYIYMKWTLTKSILQP